MSKPATVPLDKEAAKLKKAVNKAAFSRVMRLFVPYKKDVTLTLVFVIIGVFLGLLPPFFLQALIDLGLQKKNLGVIAYYSILTIVSTIAGALVTLLYGYWSVLTGQKIMCDLRNQLFQHLQTMPLKFFTSTRTGEIQTRLISDVGGVQNVVSSTIVDFLSNIAIVASCLVAMFVLDWRLTLLSIAMVPLFAVIGAWVGNFARTVRTGTQEQTGEVNAMMQETLSISGILLTKTTGRVDTLNQKFDVENQKLAGWQIKSQIIMYLFFGMIRLITSIAPALVFWLAGYLMVQQGSNLTIGTLVAFTALQTRLFFPLTGVLSAQVEILSSMALFARIFEYLDLKPEIADRADSVAIPADQAKGEIRFENVSFRYEPEQERPTLSGITFTAKPGELVALVGPSGAGKTTLTYMIPRLYDVETGSVSLDGRDVRDVKLSSLQRIVGAVTQETYLLHDTVKANLRVAKPEATDEEMIEACKQAAIHEHVSGLQEGYDTVVGERGYKLSGGEKQRLAIARAILKNPRVLILDEATSALDTHSERLVQASLAGLMEGRTTFAIAHRLSTILNADQILVIDGGQLVEKGKHEELLVKNGAYARLYNEQFANLNEPQFVK